MKNKILVTGSAGFIGFHLSKKYLENGYNVIGIDNMNDYYSVKLKEDRNKILNQFSNYKFYNSDINDTEQTENIFSNNKPDFIIHLAAQAGVRYSIENPDIFVKDNIKAFVSILEICKKFNVKDFLYASSSSVYGDAVEFPLNESQGTDSPLSLYGASKKCNEVIAHVYYKLFGFRAIGLRFFTVYGPWGRPDMALYKFADCIRKDISLPVYNHGKHERSFTYIDDIVHSIYKLSDKYFLDTKLDNGINKIFNIGGAAPTKLLDYISILEKCMNKKATIEYLPFQIGDVEKTDSDCSELQQTIDFVPNTKISEGIKEFVDWYESYYDSKK